MTIESDIKQQIKRKLEERGHGSRAALAAYLGVRPDAITRLTRDTVDKEHRRISAEELVKIADFFSCSLDDLIGRSPLHSSDDRLISLFLQSSPEIQDAVLNFVEALVHSEKKK